MDGRGEAAGGSEPMGKIPIGVGDGSAAQGSSEDIQGPGRGPEAQGQPSDLSRGNRKLKKKGSRTRRRECGKAGLSFTTYATGFEPPRSLHMTLHWVRALVHAYCLSFQQLERIIEHESDVFQDDLVLDGTDWAIMAERMSAKTKSSIWECVQHMEIAWYMMGACMDTPQWRSHAMEPYHKDISTDALGWFCEMPEVMDEHYLVSSLDLTMTPETYPRMRREPNCLLEYHGVCMARRRASLVLPMNNPYKRKRTKSVRKASIQLNGSVVQTFDPNAPYFVSLNLLAWMVGEIYDLPWQQGASGSAPVAIERAQHGHGEIPCMDNILNSPIEVLSMMSMPRELFTHHQYMLLHECLRNYMDVRPHSDAHRLMIPLRVRTMGFGSMYHMYSEGRQHASYDNMSGSRVGASLWAAGMAMNAGLACCAPSLGKRAEYKDPSKPSRYRHMEEEKERDPYGIEWSDLVDSLRDAPLAGWVPRCMAASIGHIVIGWAARMFHIGQSWEKSTDL